LRDMALASEPKVRKVRKVREAVPPKPPAEIEYPPQCTPENDPTFTRDMRRLLARANAIERERCERIAADKARAAAWLVTKAARAAKRAAPITGVMAITEAPDALRSYINEGARVRMRRYRAKRAGKRVAPYHDGRRRMTQSGPAVRQMSAPAPMAPEPTQDHHGPP
jgi:hypothetical protein